MKKFTLAVTALLFAPALALADICSDLADTYNQRLLALQRDTQAALSQTTDAAQLDAIRLSYQIQRDQLVMQRDAALASAGCSTNIPLPPEPDPDPVPPTDPDPVPPTDPDPVPPTDPDPDPVPPTDPGPGPVPPTDPDPVPPTDPDPDPVPPTDPDEGNNCPPKDACLAQLDAYADLLRAQGVKQNEFVHKMMAKIKELGCAKNYGQWNSKYKKKCEVKKKSCDYKKKKSEPKKKSHGCKK